MGKGGPMSGTNLADIFYFLGIVVAPALIGLVLLYAIYRNRKMPRNDAGGRPATGPNPAGERIRGQPVRRGPEANTPPAARLPPD